MLLHLFLEYSADATWQIGREHDLKPAAAIVKDIVLPFDFALNTLTYLGLCN